MFKHREVSIRVTTGLNTTIKANKTSDFSGKSSGRETKRKTNEKH